MHFDSDKGGNRLSTEIDVHETDIINSNGSFWTSGVCVQ